MPGNRPWSPEEDELARKLRKQGKTYKEIAQRIDRTEAAVSQRLSNVTPVDIDSRGPTLLSRTKLSFTPNAVYEINHLSHSRMRELDYLPAKFRFLGAVKGKTSTIYMFQSVEGKYLLTFTYNQIVGSYVFYRITNEQE